jgi:hypothetical protein
VRRNDHGSKSWTPSRQQQTAFDQATQRNDRKGRTRKRQQNRNNHHHHHHHHHNNNNNNNNNNTTTNNSSSIANKGSAKSAESQQTPVLPDVNRKPAGQLNEESTAKYKTHDRRGAGSESPESSFSDSDNLSDIDRIADRIFEEEDLSLSPGFLFDLGCLV